MEETTDQRSVKRTHRRTRGLFTLALIALPLSLSAQATPTVDLRDRVYLDIERMAALGLIDSVILGQRPFSEREVVRLLQNAERNETSRPNEWAHRVIAADLERYVRHGDRAFDRITIEQSVLDSPDRPAPSDGSGSIDARINPLAAYREGRPLYDGATTNVESRHSIVLGRHVALWATPLFTIGARRGNGTITKGSLQDGGARLEFGNLSLRAARDYTLFGQAPLAATVLSANAPGLDVIAISNDRPARLPYFGWLGPMRGTLSVADLGPHQNFPHVKLAAWKVSILPRPDFEFGVHVESEMGGNGAPGATLLQRIGDLFPPVGGIRNLISNGSGNTNFSNKFAGVDTRIRIPRWWGLDIYADGSLDDFDARRLASSLLQDGGIVGGFTLSCIVECGRVGLRVQYEQTGIRYYTHTDFSTGYAANHELLGDALGPRGNGGYVTLDAETDRFGTVSVTGALEWRSGNRYGGVPAGPNERNFRFVQIEHRPAEFRQRALLGWTPSSRDARLSWHVDAGVERVSDFAFIAGNDRTNALGQFRLDLRP